MVEIPDYTVKALIQHHVEGDDEMFYTLALAVAAQEARNGNSEYARDLRELIEAGKRRASSAPPKSIGQPRVPRGGFAPRIDAEYQYPDRRLADLALDKDILDSLRRVLTEQRQRDRIRAVGFAPLGRLLLVGPPGTGKRLTAWALACELGLPLFTVSLADFLGETAARLRFAVNAVTETPGVYLFDDVDALAEAQTQASGVGEVRRVLMFLRFLEQDMSGSVIVAASNHPERLDRELCRLFDMALEYPMPTGDIAVQAIRSRLAQFDIKNVDWKRVEAAVGGLSHSEISAAAEHAAKGAILDDPTNDRAQVTTEMLVGALKARARAAAVSGEQPAGGQG